jgi:ankyrin repeat protein
MARELTTNSSLDALRKEAKRWRKAIDAGDANAVARYVALIPSPAAKPTLRELQHALGREYGFSSWAALKQEIEDRARSTADRLALFLAKSAHRYGMAPGAGAWGGEERDGPVRGAMAAWLLARHPEIARDSIHTAVAAGDIDAVRAFLQNDPRLADRRGGPDNWTPLLRLAYTRLPTGPARTNAVEIARLLLDNGADPRASWSDGQNAFTALTGVIGGGEAGQSPHPQAEALARLLIERGADPLDGQALYNTSLGADDTFWLDLLWAESERCGETARWRQESTPEVNGAPLDYLLGNAVPKQPKRAAWLLAHGARADAVNTYSKRPIVRLAAIAGRQDIVDLLVSHGAGRPELTDDEKFVAAAMQANAEATRRLAQEHPEYLHNPAAMFAAMPEDRTDIAELLLDLGMSPDVGSAHGFRALHYTTHCGAVGIARMLIERGAEVDAIDIRYNSTPLGHAHYQRRPEMIALIAPHSRDIRSLCFCGAIERLEQLFVEDASLACRPSRGEAPLFALPDDDERAVEVVELLLAFGADPSVKTAAGFTPALAARKRGLEEATEILAATGK